MGSRQTAEPKPLRTFHSIPHLPHEPLSTSWFRVFWYGWYGFSSGLTFGSPDASLTLLPYPIHSTTSLALYTRRLPIRFNGDASVRLQLQYRRRFLSKG